MNKETLIKAILTALTAGTASALATIVVTNDMLRDPEIAKYAKTIRLQQKLLRMRDELDRYVADYAARNSSENLKVHMGVWTVCRMDKTAMAMKVRLNKVVDELISYTMKTFDDGSEFTEEAEYLCSDIFEGWFKPDTMSVEGLQSILDVVIPVATLRYIIHQKVHADTAIAKEFMPFAMRYKTIIMGRSRPLEDRLVLYPDHPKAQNVPYWARRA